MRIFGLIGKRLSHSFSPEYFHRFFESNNLDAAYNLFEINTIQDLETVLKTKNLHGFNITIPYKSEIIPFLTQATEAVQKTGACNCVKIVNQSLIGHNTDVDGFSFLLENALDKQIDYKAILLGNGGASKAVQFVLNNREIPFKLISRRPNDNALNWTQIITKEIIQNHQLIINTTPIGMYPDIDAAPHFPYEFLNTNHIAIDLIYNPETTLFLKKCGANQAKTINGLQMLYRQAEASWEFWNS